MARVPTIQETFQDVDTQALPNVTQSASATVENMGGAVGRATAELGQAIFQGGEAMQRAHAIVEDRNEDRLATNALVEFQTSTNRLGYEGGFGEGGQQGYYSLKGQDAVDNAGAYRAQLEAERQRLADTLSPRARQKFMDGTQRFTFAEFEQLGKHRIREDFTANRQTAEAQLSTYVNDAAAHYSDPEKRIEAIYNIREKAIELGQLNGMSTEAIAALSADWESKAHISVVQNMLSSGNIDAGKSYFGAHKEFIDGTEHDRVDALIRGAQDRAISDHLKTSARQVADLDIGIDRAQTEAELAELKNQINAADKDGLYMGRESARARQLGEIERRKAAIVTGNKDKLVAGAKLYNGLPFHTQKEADTAWTLYASTIPDADPSNPQATRDDIRDAYAGKFAAKHGMVPSEYKDLMKQAEGANDVQSLARAAAAYDAFQISAPDADTAAGDKVRAVSTAARVMGVDHTKAATYLLENKADANTAVFRDKQFDVDFPKLDARAEVGNLFDPGMLTSEPLIADRATFEYERALRFFYRQIGNTEIAKAQAGQAMQRRFGETTVGDGNRRLVEYPVEAFLPPLLRNDQIGPSDRAAYVGEDVRRILGSRGVTLPEGNDEYGNPPFDLFADGLTRKQIEAGHSQPSYQIRIRSKNGLMMALPSLRYVVPDNEAVTQSEWYKGRTEAQRAQLKAMQQQRVPGSPSAYPPEYQRMIDDAVRQREEAPPASPSQSSSRFPGIADDQALTTPQRGRRTGTRVPVTGGGGF